jgi:uncharacterized protein YdaU (DUF1376 family)
MPKKSPAFQMYAPDILASPSCSLMSAEQFGAYMLLLLHSWMADDCGIPDDPEALGRLSRLGREGWLQNGCPLVRDRFVKKGERLYNKRLLEEREKQKMWREKSAAGGRKSGKVRRKSQKTKEVNTTKGGSVLVRTKREPNHEPNTNSSSSSSSSNNPLYIPPVNGSILRAEDLDPRPELDRIFGLIRAEHPKGKCANAKKAREQFNGQVNQKPKTKISRANQILQRRIRGQRGSKICV